MTRTIQGLYRNLKLRHLGTAAELVPERYWSNFVCVGGASDQAFIVNQLLSGVPQPSSVLIVGVYGGRDFWAQKLQGHQVLGLDLAAVADCPGTVAGDAEQTWPFESDRFDVVIMGEILEHLIQDHVALAEAHRVLRSTGKLIVTVPYLHDWVEHHVRVHTPMSIRRLLSTCGFQIADYVERPGIVPLSWMNYPNHMLAAFVHIMMNRSIYGWLLHQYGKMEWAFGHSLWIPRRFMRGAWGATLLCIPVATKVDYQELNRLEFTGKD